MKNLVHYYRCKARSLYKEAQKYYDQGSDDDLLISCLKLRMCLECLSYEKVVPFNKRLELSELRKWQPRQLIKFLSKELEPYSNQNSTLQIFKEDENGKRIGKPIFTAEERVLKMEEISKYYDRLGSFLHSPTLAQIESDQNHSIEKIKKTCKEVLECIEKVLSSTVYSSPILETHSAHCHKCDNLVVCYEPNGSRPKQLEVTCSKCKLCIDVQIDTLGQSRFIPRVDAVQCPCGERIVLYTSDLKNGYSIKCDNCDSVYEYSMKFYLVE